MLLAHTGVLESGRWLPQMRDFAHAPTFLVALLVGAAVLTAMQYLAFSSVVRIGTGNFIAATAFTPLVTLIAQELAARVGVLQPMPVGWRIWPAMTVVIAGVFVMLWTGRRAPARSAP
jgi:drug/metabolite transporter (DMT)-like permease